MTIEKDWDKLAQFEKAIMKKYGEKATINPKSLWNDEKEKEYLEQLEKLQEKELIASSKEDKVDMDGFLISKKLVNRGAGRRVCMTCQVYSFNIRDDVYMTKYNCCYQCYVKWVENREQRWLAGWRPLEEKI
jgi:hypothetical protein